ncbi:hypothetical protein PsorP6_004947 [Peronosclerospora sorghi]|uniref:Uncharacterized protein n=1 Tax=Peronosclerospora sorghi TaxID=230839 RepID=A0ACC0W6I8_9STRA|nr:hypothetical protein PsorP6_004947 [Peronosclerospora sorghi]
MSVVSTSSCDLLLQRSIHVVIQKLALLMRRQYGFVIYVRKIHGRKKTPSAFHVDQSLAGGWDVVVFKVDYLYPFESFTAVS